MKLRDLLLLPIHRKTRTTLKGGRTSFLRALCLAVLLCCTAGAYAQTTVTRTSTVISGASPFQDSLWTFNPADYSVIMRMGPTLSGFTITGINGLATNPVTGVHYAILKVSGVSGRVLATIDLRTGVATQIGNLGDNFATIAFTPDGRLFGVTGDGGSVSETMYEISTADASKTLFKTLGAGDDGEVIMYNNENHYFYHWSGGTVVWERFDTTAAGAIESLTYTGAPGGETFGALDLGGGQMLVSNIGSTFTIWDTLGNITPTGAALPDDIRGLVIDTAVTTVSADGPLGFCSGDSVIFTVSGGTGDYQWTLDGAPISGATNMSYTAMASGNYNVSYTDSNGITASPATGFNVVVYPNPAVTLPANTAVCPGATVAFIPFSTTATLNFTGAPQTYTVPAGITSLRFDAIGAAGGQENASGITSPAGFGGRVQGSLTVTPGQVLNVFVGGIGGNGTGSGATGGYNGGGSTFGAGGLSGGAGGGASDIRVGGTGLGNRVVVAGGGAGNGASGFSTIPGGDGGDLIGAPGAANPSAGSIAAGGGTQSFGGTGAFYFPFFAGNPGTLGVGGNGNPGFVSGGGGGGYYGGGGGAGSGGGGGSSYTDPAMVPTVSLTHTQGYNNGGGQVAITYSLTGTYNITWGGAASAAGFTNVTAAAIPSSPLPVTVPAGVTPGIYGGIINFNDGTCNTVDYAFSIIVNDTPKVDTIASQLLCNGAATTDVIFTGPVSGTSYSWTNDNAAIGIPAAGAGDILSFTAMNAGTDFDTANITVTPMANGCTGPSRTFQIVVKPTPTLTSALTGAICDNSTFIYTPTSATAGTTFTWSRAAVTGVANPAASGSGTISEILDNTTTNPVVVTYIDTLTANGCVNTQAIAITVNPTPVLNSPLSAGAICDSTTFVYNHTSATAGTTFSWSRAAIAGNPASSGTGPISEMLTNNTTAPVVVTYIDTLTANGCTNTQAITVTLNPTPRLTTEDSVTICDSTLFHYVPASATAGTTYAWSRDTVIGISNSPATGVDSVDEVLNNTTTDPLAVTYTFTLTANGCPHVQNVTVIVNPTPTLSSALIAPTTCGGTLFSYAPTSASPGVTYTWTRAAVAGISNPTASGSGNVNEILNTTTGDRVVVTYVFTLQIGSCTNTQIVTDTVKPEPRLTSSLAPGPICDSTLFTYNPTSIVAGASFSWTRPFVPGIGALPGTGTGSISELLVNNVNENKAVSYIYTITADGCTAVQDVVVVVRPKPVLSSPVAHTICSGNMFNYTPATLLDVPVTFTYARAAVIGILPATGSGSGSIHETLTNTTTSPITVTYVIAMTVGGVCTRSQNITVVVSPSVSGVAITTKSPATLCSNTMYQNFGAATLPPTGTTYSWSATNATIYATGTNRQYILVNFNTPGTAVIRLNTSYPGSGCVSTDTFAVTVGSGTAQAPYVIFTNGQFIVLENDVDTYQWGYDDAATLDSTLVPGEINQSYMLTAPDFTNRRYWVITKRGDCMQKSYYNRPVTIAGAEQAVSVKVFPNPTNDIVNVEISEVVGGNVAVHLLNMLGQELDVVSATGNRASLNVAKLPAGVYMVDCYSNGVKITTARFVKN
ncbi:MAG: T9SS type A sorting domain-containing protein [Bacteroidota bacterium]